MKKGIAYVIALVIIYWIMALGSGCANIIPPTGGPRDSLPPTLIRVTPGDSALNFTARRIDFYFDEYVEVQNIQENLIVSPTPNVNPVVEYKLRNVTVRIKDTLEPNTTYSINFGKAIRDINESNELKDFTYVFSTGSTLDNKQLSGNVILAETGKVDSTLIVMLHRNASDSAVIKERPRYIARVDGTGNFSFRNLPEGSFSLYALKDEGSTRRYQSLAQVFAFADNRVVTSDTTAPVTLYAYVERVEEPRRPVTPVSAPRERAQKDKRLVFQTNLDNNQQSLLNNFELQFASPLKTFDSTRVQFTDITFQPVGNYSFSPDSLYKVFTLLHAWKPDSTYRIILNKDFAEDSLGNKLLKTDTITFKARKETDYGTLYLKFTTLDLARFPVLQFLQGDKIVNSFSMTSNDFRSRLFQPGDYELRILYDENRNGKWDPGSFFGLHRQPEKVQSINKKITVKANWDNNANIEL